MLPSRVLAAHHSVLAFVPVILTHSLLNLWNALALLQVRRWESQQQLVVVHFTSVVVTWLSVTVVQTHVTTRQKIVKTILLK